MKYQSLDNLQKHTEDALSLNLQQFNHLEVVEFLKNEDRKLKLLGLLKINRIENVSDVEILSNLLNDADSRVRELASEIICKFVENLDFSLYFENDDFYSMSINAVADINPCVCRNIINILSKLKNQKFIYENLFKNAEKILLELKNSDNITTESLFEKNIFKLYWNLKAIQFLILNHDFNGSLEKLEKILVATSENSDYTIREQSAYILTSLKNKSPLINKLILKLQKDENFYVRNALLIDNYVKDQV